MRAWMKQHVAMANHHEQEGKSGSAGGLCGPTNKQGWWVCERLVQLVGVGPQPDG